MPEIVDMAEKPAARLSKSSGDPIEAVFAQITGLINDDLVKKTNAVYSFALSDQKSNWFLDLKNAPGSCGQGNPPTEADATLSMTSDNFNKMFAGQLKPANAFMSGKLKISGNMGKAMKLEKLMGALQTRSYHSSARGKPDTVAALALNQGLVEPRSPYQTFPEYE